MSYFFLSYSRKDGKVMRRLRDDLQANGLEVWVDEAGLEVGTPAWQDAIATAIENAAGVVVILSPDAKKSKWVKLELEYAATFEVAIFPVMVRGNKRDAVPISLIQTQYGDARRDYPKAAGELFNALHGHLKAEKPTKYSLKSTAKPPDEDWLRWLTSLPEVRAAGLVVVGVGGALLFSQFAGQRDLSEGTGGTIFDYPTEPLVSLPLSVSLTAENCEAEQGRFEEDIESLEATLATPDAAQMRVELACDADGVDVTIHLPDDPAYLVEYLDEPATLTARLETAHARAFVQAAVAYAGGDYETASGLIESSGSGTRETAEDLLQAHVHLHLGRWSLAREVYTHVIETADDPAMRARAYAGRGLAYVLQAREKPLELSFRQACVDNAYQDFDAAVQEDPEGPLWYAGRAMTKWQCPPEDEGDFLEYDVEAIEADAERALELAEGRRPVEKATAQALLAMTESLLVDPADLPASIALAEAAMEAAPGLPSPYGALSCAYLLQNDLDRAESFYEAYLRRLVFSWEKESALDNLEAGQYCTLF